MAGRIVGCARTAGEGWAREETREPMQVDVGEELPATAESRGASLAG